VTLRPDSQLGWLMLQWLGVLAPSVFLREFAGEKAWERMSEAERAEAIQRMNASGGETAELPAEAAPELKTCACSRVVPASEWDGLYDCCSECADAAASAGDNWRESFREHDRERLVQEEQAGA